MSDSDIRLRPWLVIRQDGNGSRYRVGRCATRAEALQLADRLGGGGAAGVGIGSGEGAQRYLVERLNQESDVRA